MTRSPSIISRRGPGRNGFTLLEMLVVVAIVGILAILLFPVIFKAHEGALRVKSMANLRTLHMAAMGYVADHNGRLPLDFFGLDGRQTWASMLVREGYLPPLPPPGSLLHPLFDPGVSSAKRAQFGIANYAVNRSLTGSDYRTDAEDTTSPFRVPGPVSAVENPSKKYFIMSAGYNSLNSTHLTNPSLPFFYFPGRSENAGKNWGEHQKDAVAGRYGKRINIVTLGGNVFSLEADDVSTSPENWER